LLAAAAVNAMLAIAAGAFGAHGLEGRLDAHHLDIWETAARYHLHGALGMALCAVVARLGLVAAARAGWVLQAGVAIFSVSLYLLATTGIKLLGAITPIGGVLVLAGWGLLALAAWRARAAA
jgi:uncharacterized membrane protein YgdD (TMEM256/DUF423 family)